MFDLEPGPLEPLTLDMLRPFPTRPSFEGLLSGAREQLRGGDPALTAAAVYAVENPTAAIDARYTSTIGGAESHVDAEIGTAPTAATSALIANGDSTDRIRQSVLRFLPGPDAPISVTLDPPPMSPDVENPFPTPPPRGGDDIVGPT